MAKVTDDSGNHGGLPVSTAVEEYVSGLTQEHKMLVVLKRELYGGKWEPMLDDLANRLSGKPYIFKLVNRIKEDEKRIEELCNFESEHEVDLCNYVELS